MSDVGTSSDNRGVSKCDSVWVFSPNVLNKNVHLTTGRSVGPHPIPLQPALRE